MGGRIANYAMLLAGQLMKLRGHDREDGASAPYAILTLHKCHGEHKTKQASCYINSEGVDFVDASSRGGEVEETAQPA
jgi:hypothetical protein